MRTLTTTTALLATALFCASAAQALTRADIKRIVVEEAHNSTVPPALALAVAKVESDFTDTALSRAGARGVMQIMPATAKGVFGADPDDLWKARLNVQMGIDFLERLHRQYGGKWELALSHYNGGTLKGGSGPDAAPHIYTAEYVAKVKRWWKRYANQSRVWRVAAKRDEGFRPARTETPVAASAPAPRPVVVRERAPETAQRRRAIIRWWREDGSLGKGFWRRLRQARETMDDFGPRKDARS